MSLDQSVKQAVSEYWDRNPCGAFAADERSSQRLFFEQVARYRYASQPFMRRLINFDGYPGKRVLEVGCGLGTDLLQFAQGKAAAVGIDLSSQSLSLARQQFQVYDATGSFALSDAENLPFADASFDVVYSFGVLHHTPDTQKAIDECCRVLKSGGTLILMLYNRTSWQVLVEPYLLVAKRRALRQPVPHGVTDPREVVRRYDGADNPLGKAYTRREVRRMLDAFVNIRIHVRSPRLAGGSSPWLAGGYTRFLEWSTINRRWGFWIVAHAQRPMRPDGGEAA